MSDSLTPIPADEKTILGHPKGLFVLFLAEMWERFSFYGMRALLTLYMVKGFLQYGDKQSAGTYGAYTALVYLFPVLGGYLAERYLGYRRSIILGGTLMAIGHGVMTIEHVEAFYFALGFLTIGNGFFKPNISSTVGKLYAPGDARRDAGFTIFYMGINTGALLAPWVCGPLGENVGWHYGFGAATIGMVFGLVVFVWGTGLLHGRADPRDPALARKATLPIWGGSLLLVWMSATLVQHYHLVQYLLNFTAVLTLIALIVLACREDAIGRNRLFALMILMIFHAAFWAGFEQSGSSLTLFTDRVVDREMPLLGEQPTSWFQGINPFFILLFAPLFSFLWVWTARRGIQPSIPAKFSLGLIQLGLGYGVLVWGMTTADVGSKTSWLFIVLMYMLHTTGELCLSPVGLSAVTKLAPAKAVGFVMGAWFLTIAYGNLMAGEIAGFTEVKFEQESALHELTDKQYAIATAPDEAGAEGMLLTLREGTDLPGAIEHLGARGVDRDAVLDRAVALGFPEAAADAFREAPDAEAAKAAIADHDDAFRVGGDLDSLEIGKITQPKSLPEVMEILGTHGIGADRVLDHTVGIGVVRGPVAEEIRMIAGDASPLPAGENGEHPYVEALDLYTVRPILEFYEPVYFYIFIVTLGMGLLLLVLSVPIKRMMHGIE